MPMTGTFPVPVPPKRLRVRCQSWWNDGDPVGRNAEFVDQGLAEIKAGRYKSAAPAAAQSQAACDGLKA